MKLTLLASQRMKNVGQYGPSLATLIFVATKKSLYISLNCLEANCNTFRRVTSFHMEYD
jgi:hypothetical protein